MKKIGTLLLLALSFLLGSKAGRRPYESFMKLMKKIRRSNFVSKPIEAVADRASNAVRAHGTALADKAADATYTKIANIGDSPTPVVVEIDVVDEPVLVANLPEH